MSSWPASRGALAARYRRIHEHHIVPQLTEPAADPGRGRKADRAHLRPHRALSQRLRDAASEDHRVNHVGGRQHRDHHVRIPGRLRRRRCHQRPGPGQRRSRGGRPIPDRGTQPGADQIAGHRRAHDAGPQHRHPHILATAIPRSHLSLPPRSDDKPGTAAPQPSRTTPDEHSPGWAGEVPAGASTVVARSRERVWFAFDHVTPGHGRQPGHPGQTSCHIRVGRRTQGTQVSDREHPRTRHRNRAAVRVRAKAASSCPHRGLSRISRAVRPSSCDRLSRIGSARAGHVRCAAAPVPAEQEPSRRATQRHPASEPVILTWIPAAAQVRAPCARHPPTLIAAARSQTTASSPRGTVSQADLTVISNSPRVRELADPCLLTPDRAPARTCEGCRRWRVVLIYPQSP